MNRRFCFTIDADWAPGSEAGLAGLMDLCRRLQLPATVFFAGKLAESQPDLLRDVIGQGHEVGAHGWLHCVDEKENFRDAPVEEQRHLLGMATRAIEAATGARPMMFRAPNLWVSETMLDVLAEAGYRLDSSVPARRYGGQCRSFKYFWAPLTPYHPSRTHLGRRGDSPILEVAPSCFACVPINMSGLRVFGMRPLAWATRRLARRTPVLIFYCHPCEFVPADKQYVSPNDPKRYRQGLGPQNFAVLERYVRYVLDLGYRPARLSEELDANRRADLGK